MRLVLLPKPHAAREQARLAVQRSSRRGQHRTLDPRTLASADHLVVLTSLAPDAYSAAQVGALYRLRRQVERAVKRLKSLLHVDRVPARGPDLARAWLHARLLAARLAEDAIADSEALSP